MEAQEEERSQDQSGRGSSLKSLLEGTNKELILLIASFVVMSIVAVLIVFLIAGPKNSDQTAKKNNDRQKQKDEKSDGKEAVFDD
jgi:flagellar basal body-associated protein FliL